METEVQTRHEAAVAAGAEPEVLERSDLQALIAGEVERVIGASRQPHDLVPMRQETRQPAESPLRAALAQVLGGQELDESRVITLRQGEYRVIGVADLFREHEASMSAGAIAMPIESALNGIVPNVQVGTILVGGLSGLIVGEVIDGLFSPRKIVDGEERVNLTNLLVKGGAAFAIGAFGSKVMSKQAVLLATGVLIVQILADVLPIDGVVEMITKPLAGFVKQEQTASHRQLSAGHHQPASHHQAPPVATATTDRLADEIG